MTYSYARQEWVENRILEGDFGITTISLAAQIPESTGKSWLRQTRAQLPTHRKMAREYERAMGILLLVRFPNCKSQIASIVFTNSRTLDEWVKENNNRPRSSDLRWQTNRLMTYMRPSISTHFELDSIGSIYLTKGRWPDSSNFTRDFNSVLDLCLYALLQFESDYRFEKIDARLNFELAKVARMGNLEDFENYGEDLKELPHIPMYGPHRYRYSYKIDWPNTGFYFRDCQAYNPGGLAGVNIGGHYDPAKTLSMRMDEFFESLSKEHIEALDLSDLLDVLGCLKNRTNSLDEEVAS